MYFHTPPLFLYLDRSASVFAPLLLFFPAPLYATSYDTNASSASPPAEAYILRMDLKLTCFIVAAASFSSCSSASFGSSLRFKSLLSGWVDETM